MGKSIAEYTNEDWKQARKEMSASICAPRTFRELIREIFDNNKDVHFVAATGLSEYMFGRLKNQICKEDLPQRNTLMSVCIGYDLGIEKATELLHSLGLCFQPYNERDYAYQFLLNNCRGKSIDECNGVLRKLGIEERYWLGKYARRNRGQ